MIKCKECGGDGYYWLAGASAHPSNRYECEVCKGKGQVKEKKDK